MPYYLYECPKCRRQIELEQKIKDRCAPLCCEENCNIEMETVVTTTGFILKGSGWARDGYQKQVKSGE